MTSLVGHSGSGKSTIMNLIPRFYDSQSGDITIDKQSIYKTTINSLRREISMVSQETTLFDDTIKNNIIFNDEKIVYYDRLSLINKLKEREILITDKMINTTVQTKDEYDKKWIVEINKSWLVNFIK